MEFNGSILKSAYRELIRRDSNKSVMLQGAGAAFFIKIIGHGLAFVVQILLARSLGVNQFGDYVYVITWGNLLLLIANMGIDTSSLRFVASYNSKQQWPQLLGFIRWGKIFPFFGSLAVGGLLIGAVLLFNHLIRGDLVIVFIISAFLLPVLGLSQITASMIRGFKIITKSQGPVLIIRPFLIILSIVLLTTSSAVKLTAAHAMGINIFCTLMTLLILLKILQALLPQSANISSSRQETKKWIATSMSLVLVSALYLVNKQTDIMMIGFILDTSKSGIYSASSRLANFISFGLVAMNAIAAPVIAELYTQKKFNELQRMVKLVVWFASCFAVLMGLIMIFWGKDILALFGNDFIQSYNCLAILMLGQIVNSFAGPVGLLMTMTSYQNEAALIIGCSAALNIVLNLIFIPLFGIQGAAVATVITAVLWNLALVVRVAGHLNLNPTIFPFTIKEQI